MSTKRLRTVRVEATATDVSNGYLTLVEGDYELTIKLWFRSGAENNAITVNSPANGQVTISDIRENEQFSFLIVY